MSGSRTTIAPSPLFPPDGRAEPSRCAAAAREVNAGCVVLVPPPALQPDPQLTLPLDINDYPMAKYVRGHFQVRWAPRPGSGELFPTGRQLLGSPWQPDPWWSSEVQGPRGGSPPCPTGLCPAPTPGTARVAREAGSGVVVVLWGAGCHLPPSPWVPVVSRGRGDPAEVIGERQTR